LRAARHRFEGVDFHVYSKRAGRPPLVLLHGFLDSAHTFRRLFEGLAARFDLYAVDIPGFGYSRLPDVRELWHIDGIARCMARFLDSVPGLERPLLLSHSMGGLVALHMEEYWRRREGRPFFRELHMIGPAILRLPVEERDAIRGLLYPKSVAEIRILLGKLYYRDFPALPGIVLRGLLRSWSRREYEYLAENTIEFEERIFFTPERLKAMDVPIRAYSGSADELFAGASGRLLRELEFIGLYEIEDAGHAPHLEKPEQFLRIFLRQAAPGIG
jgi:pimeloyl-ACP methyl ester carboxylesterase